MKGEKYNGWANRDTWLVVLHLENTRSNYEYCKTYKRMLVQHKKAHLIRTLKLRCKFTDYINWNNVHITEVKNAIREM